MSGYYVFEHLHHVSSYGQTVHIAVTVTRRGDLAFSTSNGIMATNVSIPPASAREMAEMLVKAADAADAQREAAA